MVTPPISKFNLRLPWELRLKLNALAAENRRSLNQEIIYRLWESLKPRYR